MSPCFASFNILLLMHCDLTYVIDVKGVPVLQCITMVQMLVTYTMRIRCHGFRSHIWHTALSLHIAFVYRANCIPVI